MSPKRTFSIPSTLIDTQTGTCLSRGRFISQPPLQISQHVTGSDQWALDHKTLLKGRDYALFLLSLLKILEQKFKQPSLPKKKVEAILKHVKHTCTHTGSPPPCAEGRKLCGIILPALASLCSDHYRSELNQFLPC